MQQKRSFLPIFLLFFILSLLAFSLSGFLSRVGFFTTPLFMTQGEIFRVISLPANLFTDKKFQTLQDQNKALLSQLVKMQQIQQDNIALRDQFATTDIPTSVLIPAQVIGAPQFVPGISLPENLIINKGKQDGVTVGETVIYKNNIVGLVSATSDHAAQILLVSNKKISFTARTSSTNAQGVLTGQGGGSMVLGNVVLSDSLKVGDMVITSGSEGISGKGFPPGLIVGKISSINKNPSSLYQSASVESLLQMQKLTTVFIQVHSY